MKTAPLTYIFHHFNMLYYRRHYAGFMSSSKDLRSQQEDVLMRLILANRDTTYGREHHFDKIKDIPTYQKMVPIVDYENILPYVEQIKQGQKEVLTHCHVRRFIPSSGSSSSSKLIPYNDALRRDFSHALYTWLYDLYLRFPEIKRGKSFWIISPVVPPNVEKSKVPVEFATDSSYFGRFGRILIDRMMAVPSFLSVVTDMENYYYLLSLFLLQTENLRLISVWNPSLLTIILHKILQFRNDIIRDLRRGAVSEQRIQDKKLRKVAERYLHKNPRRSELLEALLPVGGTLEDTHWNEIWPDLRVISAWSEGWAYPGFQTIKRLFPKTYCQGKGLLMTEGIVSIPIIDKKSNESKTVLTTDIHFYEFCNTETREILLVDQLVRGHQYEVIMTTSGGLYRYRTHDIVRFEGYFEGKIHLSFVGKNDVISDVRGEKLNAFHVGKALKKLLPGDIYGNYFLAPFVEEEKACYILFLEQSVGTPFDITKELCTNLDKLLMDNYHYKNCRILGQLSAPKIYWMDGRKLDAYRGATQQNKLQSTAKDLPLIADPDISTQILNASVSKPKPSRPINTKTH